MHGDLHHVEIYVSDLDRSKDFWGWFLGELGYTVYQEWDAGISYLKGHTYIVFVQTLDAYQSPQYHRCRTGLNHLAFHAESPAFVDRITRQLIQRGVTLLYHDRFPHAGGDEAYGLFFEDPDRIKVELTCDI